MLTTLPLDLLQNRVLHCCNTYKGRSLPLSISFNKDILDSSSTAPLSKKRSSAAQRNIPSRQAYASAVAMPAGTYSCQVDTAAMIIPNVPTSVPTSETMRDGRCQQHITGTCRPGCKATGKRKPNLHISMQVDMYRPGIDELFFAKSTASTGVVHDLRGKGVKWQPPKADHNGGAKSS